MREILKDTMVAAFAAAPSGEWVVSSNGFYRSTDGGKRWTRVGPDVDMAGALHVAEDGLYGIGTTLFGPGGQPRLAEGDVISGLYRSRDAGATWTPVRTWKARELELSGVSRTPKGTLLIGHGAQLGMQGRRGISRSVDGGKTWSSVTSEGGALGFAAGADGTLYAADANGVLVSTDDGASWKRSAHAETTVSVRVKGGSLFAGGLGGLYRSDDRAKTWTPIDAFKGKVAMPIVLPEAKLAVLTQALDTGVNALMVSLDSGKTWKPATAKIPAGVFDSALSDGSAIVLVRRNGVLRSTDGGMTFQSVFP
jgi:photosystem II stability/assembly factor-like uncharacterized protein